MNTYAKKIARSVCTLVAVLAFYCSFGQNNITVAVAANMQYAAEALKVAFEAEGRGKVDLVIGSSGKLTQQIISSAPFDIFISADTSYPRKLFDAGLAAERPRVYARGLLVLWTLNPLLKPVADLKLLLASNVKSIAIANPKNAPYGAAAESLIKKYGLYERVQPKLVYGESIAQTSQFIATRAADIGFTAKAIVLSDEMTGKGVWIDLRISDYPPILQSVVLLRNGVKKYPVESRKFYTFLFSAKAKAILNKFGYVIWGG